MLLYISDILFYCLTCLCNVLWPLCFVSCWSSCLYNVDCLPFFLICVFLITWFLRLVGRFWCRGRTPHQLRGFCYYTWPSYVCPQLVWNRSFGDLFALSRFLFWILCGCRGFWNRTESDNFPFLCYFQIGSTTISIQSMFFYPVSDEYEKPIPLLFWKCFRRISSSVCSLFAWCEYQPCRVEMTYGCGLYCITTWLWCTCIRMWWWGGQNIIITTWCFTKIK